ncbi:DUF4956 domain-containing protein [Echinicola sp. CAU 1574]|uniref:DUF4956 domain-containing protein n=1 Tax=Echinicola arenosa TaxID=2774144 RepID=A0ABR9AN87_9BACT|nr:DUF4956 domain-containing protein [Echinicola arenosa]MBD8489079.1 DUF4956 domain-containing protein [Echinicola arenosa]
MEQDLQQIFTFSLTVREAIANIIVSLVSGVFIALLYRVTYKGVSYSSNFTNAIIMLTMITTLVIMVIGNNLARAFGLVGAMSIIRFRTAVKDSQDIMFIFFALGIGLSAGVGLYAVTISSTLLIGLAIIITTKLNYSTPPKREYLLQLVYLENKIGEDPFQSTLKRYCSKDKIVNLKGSEEEEGNMIELSYYIKLKSEEKGPLLVSDLKKISGVSIVNLFFDEY